MLKSCQRTAARCGSTGGKRKDSSRPVTERVRGLRAREEAAGTTRLETYSRFAEQVKETKRKLLEF